MGTPKPTILLVDDEPDFLSGAKLVLESAGYEVLAAPSAHAALVAAREHTVSLAVLDVNLPDGDGYDLCRVLRRNREGSDLPVLILSVRQSMKDMLEGIASGARDYLAKPVGGAELLRAVASGLAA